MRTQKEIEDLIQALEKDIEKIRNNRSKWSDENVPRDMINENMYRVHTLEWVLGKHERFD